ncbi:PhoX family protein [Azospirillum sp. ST 5-10]|uniref:PhoX family protein n=1 Tax=unclassified Azospirillum TaxID=2630922 RepID=UPI003F49DD27
MKPYDIEANARADLASRGISPENTFENVLERHLARRAILRGGVLAAAAAAVPGVLVGGAREAKAAPAPLTFQSLAQTQADTVTVPPGYAPQVVIKWGDALFPNVGPFDIYNQSGADQAKRFGFNNDMVALFPLPYGAPAKLGGRLPHTSYLMCVNHEYATGVLQFPDYPILSSRDSTVTNGLPTRNQVETQMESLGCTVVEINLVDGAWVPNVNSPYNRRVTATTLMDVTGPARGDTLLQTPADPAGTVIKGTFANCAGGQTPWGTYLSCEENFDGYFNNLDLMTDATLKAIHTRLGNVNRQATVANASDYTLFWDLYDPRFDLSTDAGAREPFRFGWVVEFDPYDPSARPKKRTALGRCKHEAAQTVLNAADRVAVYTGDDERFEYVYKFVSDGTVDRGNRAANAALLDEGTLYVARFNDDGTGQWLPMTYEAVNALAPGQFRNQADVLINAREAADVLGATPMDRPEDIEAPRDGNWRGSGKVYVVCTNNTRRTAAQVDGANPRASNAAGHIIELTEAGNDHAATSFAWSIFLLAGDPAAPAGSNINVSVAGVPTFEGDAFGSPDNIAFDSTGNLFIATDGTGSATPDCNDQVVVTPTTGGFPRQVKRFLVGPVEAEICGPLVAPDDSTFFCAIQHPGEDGTIVDRTAEAVRTSTWPTGGHPASAVVAVRRTDGGRIGS